LLEIEESIKEQLIGKDHLTQAELLIEKLGNDLEIKEKELKKIIELQKTDFVPIITKEKIEKSLKEVEVTIANADTIKNTCGAQCDIRERAF
jgi:hypothetical protein